MNLGLQFMIVVGFADFSQATSANVLAYWSLNGSEPGLTLHGGPTFVEGRYPGSKAINFNQPSNCFARIPKVELRDKSFTIALWVKVNSILADRDQTVFSDWYSPYQFFLAVKNTGIIQFVRHSTDANWYGPSLESTSRIDAGKWFHIAVTWDQSGGVSKLYIDAKEDNTLAIDKSRTWQPPRDTYEIGDDGRSNEHFLGSVMDLYIIDGVLNSEQINHLRGYPEITSSYLNNTVVYKNETVKCQAKGSPTPYVAWARSGVVLVNKTSTAEITITENNGEYVCVASNKEGTKNITVKAKAPFQLCHDHLFITDVSRAANYISQSSQVKNDNTDLDLRKWYRIQSPAGNQLPTTCVPQNRCGTQAPGWLNGAHPSIQDGIAKRMICFHFNGDCCYQNTTVHIRKCFGYYVYKFSGVPGGLPGRYCIENQQHDNQDHPDTVFQAIDKEAGSRLTGYVIHTETDVQVVFVCMSYCQLYNNCKSFNFHSEKKICELNNATRQEQPDAYQKKASYVTYYEKIDIIGV